jgi:hypothetical protein
MFSTKSVAHGVHQAEGAGCGWDIYLVGGVRALAETLARILEAEPERADWIALTLPALWRGIRDWDLPEDRGKAKGVYGRDL